MSNSMRELIDLANGNKVASAVYETEISEVDMGQALSVQDRADARDTRPFYTPEEEREVRSLRNNPHFWDDTEEGLALVARLHEIKAAANARRSQR